MGDAMKVRVTAFSAGMEALELGTVEGEEAVRLFNAHKWQAELDRAEDMEARGENCTDPDMTFTALSAHLVASASAPNRFNVEVCLPRPAKLLGIFNRSKFYEFKSIQEGKVAELIRIFCTDLLDHKHALFEAQIRATDAAAT
jgi:hypothetical protein